MGVGSCRTKRASTSTPTNLSPAMLPPTSTPSLSSILAMSLPPANVSQLQQADSLLAESPREAEQLLLSILQSKPGAPLELLVASPTAAARQRQARWIVEGG